MTWVHLLHSTVSICLVFAAIYVASELYPHVTTACRSVREAWRRGDYKKVMRWVMWLALMAAYPLHLFLDAVERVLPAN